MIDLFNLEERMRKNTKEGIGHMEERIGHKIEENMQRLVKLIQNLEENEISRMNP